ncbi:hypothetical protein Dcar01_01481 [Deinococcus carri]|uniref:AB hydrolase-1 domain-containing protein n=1 Tax=Deinococcus carri TaxID=1211323 RepID=A0ABP9W5Y9_9DEIO
MTIPGLDLPPLPDAARLTLPLGDVTLGGYYWMQSRPAPAVLLLHGWGQDASHMAHPARLFREAGWHALSLSQRGWRGSGGCDDYGRSGADDMRRALDWLGRQPGVTSALLLGFSMGGLVALLAASAPCAARGVVAVSAPTDLRRTARTTSLGILRRYYDAVLTERQWVEGSPLRHVARLRVPALLVVGTEDRFCPPAEGRSYAAATGSCLLELPGMAHQPTDEEWRLLVRETLGMFGAEV